MTTGPESILKADFSEIERTLAEKYGVNPEDIVDFSPKEVPLEPNRETLTKEFRHESTLEEAVARACENQDRFGTAVLVVSVLPDLHIIIPHSDINRAAADILRHGFDPAGCPIHRLPPLKPWVRKKDPMKKKIREYSS